MGPRLRKVLYAVFGLVALLGANSLYLVVLRVTGFENYFYLWMIVLHLALGVLLIGPLIAFGVIHWRTARNRPHKRAIRLGKALFLTSLVILISGVALMMRLLPFLNESSPQLRTVMYWVHVLSPLAAVWLYLLHRLAGPAIKWKAGLGWMGAVAGFILLMIGLQAQDPRQWNPVGPEEGEKYFQPSLARTSTGNFIGAETLMMDEYCKKCHPDVYDGWFHSVHHFSSFNNEPYLFSVRETRKVSLERDGDVRAARFCAGCHDPVPFFSGAFDDPNFDDVNHPTAHAGVTCTVCHSIVAVNSPRGNAAFTIEEPLHYPFAYNDNPFLQYLNEVLVTAKPSFHKKTFLKPLHKSADFCSTCHKVFLPGELTKYKEFLRGQNHYDSFLLSGVSGHGARSFYYPEHAEENCNNCHMPAQLAKLGDFAGKRYEGVDGLAVRNHLFLGANTAIPHLRGDQETVETQQDFLRDDLVRVDIFGVREGGTINGELTAPIRPDVPALTPGKTYLLETVVRTLKLGHHFTQGTADSNQIWLDVTVTSGDRVIGRSGALDEEGAVDPWSHFINVYMLDRDGNRIDRRNAQDIFTPLYNNQIPPGAGQAVHYLMDLPDDLSAPVTVDVKLKYRKFDKTYMTYVFGEDYEIDLPITTMAEDRVTFPLAGLDEFPIEERQHSPIPEWQRWNDYGIGLFLEGADKGGTGQLRNAERAFNEVVALDHNEALLHLARVYMRDGHYFNAAGALNRAAEADPPPPRWTTAWLNGMVHKQTGNLEAAATSFRSVLEDDYEELRRRGFDFSRDYMVINELGHTLMLQAGQCRTDETRERRRALWRAAVEQFEKTLALDPDNVMAHWNLSILYERLGDAERAAEHTRLHAMVKPDDNARDRAVTRARRADPAADHAANPGVIYDLTRSLPDEDASHSP